MIITNQHLYISVLLTGLLANTPILFACTIYRVAKTKLTSSSELVICDQTFPTATEPTSHRTSTSSECCDDEKGIIHTLIYTHEKRRPDIQGVYSTVPFSLANKRIVSM
jgi:hypothetical protein